MPFTQTKYLTQTKDLISINPNTRESTEIIENAYQEIVQLEGKNGIGSYPAPQQHAARHRIKFFADAGDKRAIHYKDLLLNKHFGGEVPNKSLHATKTIYVNSPEQKCNGAIGDEKVMPGQHMQNAARQQIFLPGTSPLAPLFNSFGKALYIKKLRFLLGLLNHIERMRAQHRLCGLIPFTLFSIDVSNQTIATSQIQYGIPEMHLISEHTFVQRFKQLTDKEKHDYLKQYYATLPANPAEYINLYVQPCKKAILFAPERIDGESGVINTKIDAYEFGFFVIAIFIKFTEHKQFAELIQKCIAINPELRPDTAEIREELEKLIALEHAAIQSPSNRY